ncbi:hypothetical protein ACFO5R_09095 [Halosolutus amylolyticus]|uniref:Uncharacterized protein n=1 Tax=Halosolutus amylolyticus TaxID=2932267 RepID=A0ABD5PNF9_9EURY|nr:hypothetical protein [Halosolutus amylolyticus]
MDQEFWTDLRSTVEDLDPGAELVTPVSERRFEVDAVDADRLTVRFTDSGERQPLWREQFGVLVDRLPDEAIPVADLPPRVEPYAAVLTLSGAYTVVDDAIVRDPERAVGGESPYLLSAIEARTAPERVHDDALLLADFVERLEADAEDPESLDTDSLTDLYVLLSDVQRGTDRMRTTARDALLDRLGPDQRLAGRFGAVRRTTRERRRPKDEETVLDALDEHGIPREWVLGIDRDKLDVVLTVTGLSTADVYDVTEDVYVQKVESDETEKGTRLEGLATRIDDLQDEASDELYAELSAIEDRLEEALSAG